MNGVYYIDGVDISSFGAVGVLASEASALTGVFNLPRRKGETEHNWGTEIEAFVDSKDIELYGRTLTLTVLVKGTTYAEYLERLNSFKTACIQCKVLGTVFGNFNVIQKDDITITEYPNDNIALVTLKFYEDVVVLPLLGVTSSGGSGFLIDNYNLRKDFGIGVSEIKDTRNPGKRIDVNTTATYKQTKYRDKSTITLKCWMIGSSLVDLYNKMGQFSTLCMKPGLRALTMPDGSTLDLYIKDGITVKIEHETALAFDLKLRVV